MKPSSKRFTPSTFTERIIPLLLVLVALGLLATILIVVLSLVGLTPGF